MGKFSKKGIGAQRNSLKVTPELFEQLKDLMTSKIDENHHEVPCPQPEELVVSKRPPSLKEQIQRLIRQEVSEQANDQEMETWDEANDFEVDEDHDPLSGFEIHDMLEEEPLLPDNSGEAEHERNTKAPVLAPSNSETVEVTENKDETE